LRLDLRGHGESINAGKFIPFDEANNAKIFIDEYTDVSAAMQWLRARDDVDTARLAVVGASYSAEVAADAARREGKFVKAYAMLSPGSLSEESAKNIDPSGAHWLIVRAANERSPSVRAAAERVAAISKSGEVRVIDSDKHATDLLEAVPELAPWLAYWLQQSLAQ
jgi:pimeloyl-ACP methyl ester carboxylesterase